MERRNRSLKALKELIYIDSLDSFAKADAMVRWFDSYLKDDSIENFDLELNDLKKLEELFFKSINFLKNHTKYWYIFFKRYIIKENVFFCDSTLFLEN